MRSIGTRLVALMIATIGYAFTMPTVSSAEVGGFHLNLTPYAGFNSWAKETNLQDKLVYGGRVGLGFGKYIGIEGTYGISSTQTQTGLGFRPYPTSFGPAGATADADFTHMAADLVLNLVPNSTVNPYLLGGYSKTEFDIPDSGFKSEPTGFNVGAGLKLHFSPRVALRLEARDMIYNWEDEDQALGASDKSQNSMSYTGGLMLSIGGDAGTTDTDLDGVGDKKDMCPNTPAGCVVDATGCPLDADGDSVCDGVDTCPSTPKGAQVDLKGCPTDADADGVFDGIDQCPNTPAGCTVDATGCPVDSDKDGVCDGLDQCANTPAGARVDEKGCPMDSDADGVPDGIDLCPNTPAGARVDKDGCPIEISVREQEMLDKGVITARDIYFDTAKSTIKPESEKTLQELCEIFKQWPTLQIEIGGHADARGSDAYNLQLSEERAAAVREWGQANCPGLTQGNFTSKGYGETKPVASNKNAKGQALNRRVEFKVMNPEELKRLKERRETLMKEQPSN